MTKDSKAFTFGLSPDSVRLEAPNLAELSAGRDEFMYVAVKEPDEPYKINSTGKSRSSTFEVELNENEQMKYFLPLADDSIIVVPETIK